MKQIAAEAGVSVMTVSYSLRDHPEIPRTTRERVKAVAERMGFRPDPMLSALVAYRGGARRQATHGALALVTQMTPRHLQSSTFGKRVTASIRRRARQLGYDLEVFWLDPAMSPARASDILLNRGIKGLIVAPPARPGGELRLDWNQFSAVALGRSLGYPRLDFVSANQYNAGLRLHDELVGRGYARIGFVGCADIDARVQHRFFGGYAAREAERADGERIRPLLRPELKSAELKQWIKDNRPDAIIADGVAILPLLEDLGVRVPEKIGVALCIVDDTNQRCCGMRPNFELIGARSADFLHMKMLHDEKGPPEQATGWVIEGEWHEGETLRPVADAKVTG